MRAPLLAVVTASLLLPLLVAAAPPPTKALSVRDAWSRLAVTEQAATGNACGDDLMFDYGAGGGMRNFFCRTLTFFSWKTFLKLAPVAPFRAGPHKGGKLNLKSERDFGRYDPRFVRWAVDTLVPGANDAELRAATQSAYDTQIRALARTYYSVWRAISSDKGWLEREVITYLRAADDRSVSWDQNVVWFYHDVLGTSEESWGGNDPNHVRSATMFWLRRTKDGTAKTWVEGLEKLLATYDGAWLSDAKSKPFDGRLPQRPAVAQPEYR
jgi:hypothetical protein